MCPLLLLRQVVVEGEAGDKFYIIKEGEAVVFQSGPGGRQHKVNHLFKADFFGERALLVQEPRMATVRAARCTVLCFALLASTCRLLWVRSCSVSLLKGWWTCSALHVSQPHTWMQLDASYVSQ
jgi:hypothetical protein